jgi:hypothetical protein
MYIDILPTNKRKIAYETKENANPHSFTTETTIPTGVTGTLPTGRSKY